MSHHDSVPKHAKVVRKRDYVKPSEEQLRRMSSWQSPGCTTGCGARLDEQASWCYVVLDVLDHGYRLTYKRTTTNPAGGGGGSWMTETLATEAALDDADILKALDRFRKMKVPANPYVRKGVIKVV